MKLLFELRPVDHLDASVDDYRSLGLEPLGWPDDDTAMLGPRGGAATIVLVRDPAESALGVRLLDPSPHLPSAAEPSPNLFAVPS
jgi:hypothetical protein